MFGIKLVREVYDNYFGREILIVKNYRILTATDYRALQSEIEDLRGLIVKMQKVVFPGPKVSSQGLYHGKIIPVGSGTIEPVQNKIIAQKTKKIVVNAAGVKKMAYTISKDLKQKAAAKAPKVKRVMKAKKK